MSSTSSSIATGVAGLITTPGLHPCDAIKCSVRSRCMQTSWWTDIQVAPASANAGINSSGFSIIKWQSNGTSRTALRSDFTTGGPIVIFGTKCPSMMSTCSTVPPPSIAALACSPRREKSAERIDGASSICTMLPFFRLSIRGSADSPLLRRPGQRALLLATGAAKFEHAHDVERPRQTHEWLGFAFENVANVRVEIAIVAAARRDAALRRVRAIRQCEHAPVFDRLGAPRTFGGKFA